MTKKNTLNYSVLNRGSLYQWALVIFLILTLPLFFTIIYTALEVKNHTQNSHKTLSLTVNTTQQFRDILERLIITERSIRQFKVLSDPKLLIAYQEHRDKFVENISTINYQGLNNKSLSTLKHLIKKENIIYLSIIDNVKDKNTAVSTIDLNGFDLLTKRARDLIKQGENRVNQESSNLSINSRKIGQKLYYLALASIPLTLLLGMFFLRTLTRPIKNIGLAIRNLGEIGFEDPIAINGPRELTEIGVHLEWFRQRLNRLENETQQFIRNVSHELKTPLASIKEGTDLLAENVVGELNTEQQEIIQLMKMGNITLNDLVENLLEYQKTISMDAESNFSTFELGPLITKISNDYELLLRSKNISLKSNLSAVKIHADYEKLKIIISNIFSNALKFSPQDGTIGLNLYSSSDNIIQLVIEDQGPGITKDIQPLIFKDFYQGSAPQGWKIKASGLGLALVRYYLELHNGTVKLLPATKEFCGARFSLQLPQQQEKNDTESI